LTLAVGGEPGAPEKLSPTAPVTDAVILVVDDDDRLRSLLQRYLSDQGFVVTTAPDAASAERHLETVQFDLIVLDVMMPGETGVSFTRRLRTRSAIPVLLLTARNEVDDRIAGLEAGADDYLAKPFEPRELVLRIRTILKRAAVAIPTAPARPARVQLGIYGFDPHRNLLLHGDEPVHLTQGEASLLAFLAARPGVTVTRDDLTAAGFATGFGRTIDVQVTRLRRKFETDPKFPRYLQTVRGQGYVLMPD
jgi:two-component system phosphate regulon response regulator OmpR